MKFDHLTIDTLITWTRAHAPRDNAPGHYGNRRVRLEIAAEWCADPQNSGSVRGVVARAYLAEPRCTCERRYNGSMSQHDPACEKRGPLAETRLG